MTKDMVRDATLTIVELARLLSMVTKEPIGAEELRRIAEKLTTGVAGRVPAKMLGQTQLVRVGKRDQLLGFPTIATKGTAFQVTFTFRYDSKDKDKTWFVHISHPDKMYDVTLARVLAAAQHKDFDGISNKYHKLVEV